MTEEKRERSNYLKILRLCFMLNEINIDKRVVTTAT